VADRNPSQVMLALTSEADQAKAEALALALLERRLVACVSLQPQRALYHWHGQLESATEVQLLLKTDARRLDDLAAAVHALHSYATPEWLVWPAAASSSYAGWLAAELAPPDGRPA